MNAGILGAGLCVHRQIASLALDRVELVQLVENKSAISSGLFYVADVSLQFTHQLNAKSGDIIRRSMEAAKLTKADLTLTLCCYGLPKIHS